MRKPVAARNRLILARRMAVVRVQARFQAQAGGVDRVGLDRHAQQVAVVQHLRAFGIQALRHGADVAAGRGGQKARADFGCGGRGTRRVSRHRRQAERAGQVTGRGRRHQHHAGNRARLCGQQGRQGAHAVADDHGRAIQHIQRADHVLAQVRDGHGREGGVLRQRAVAAQIKRRAGQARFGEVVQIVRVAPGAVIRARHKQQTGPAVLRRRADYQPAAASAASGQLVGQAEIQRVDGWRAGGGRRRGKGRDRSIHLAAMLSAAL